MDSAQAVTALTSLAQEARLATFRLLVRAGTDGLAAGEIAREIGMPASSLSFHLTHLTGSGLVTQQRQSRRIIYRANFGAMTRLVDFLLENCCEGQACEADPGMAQRNC